MYDFSGTIIIAGNNAFFAAAEADAQRNKLEGQFTQQISRGWNGQLTIRDAIIPPRENSHNIFPPIFTFSQSRCAYL
jgi:hypothetical protein